MSRPLWQLTKTGPGGEKGRTPRVPQEEVGKRSSIPFFVFGTLSVTFSDASVTFFVTLRAVRAISMARAKNSLPIVPGQFLSLSYPL